MLGVFFFGVVVFLSVVVVEGVSPPDGEQPIWRSIPGSDRRRRYHHCAVYCSNLDQFFVFGGTHESPKNNVEHVTDFEAFDFKTETWSTPTLTSGPETEPAPRYGCGFEVIDDVSDPDSCIVLLFGGVEQPGVLVTAIPMSSHVGVIEINDASQLQVDWSLLPLISENANNSTSDEADPVMPLDRLHFGVTKIDDDIYMFGGSKGFSSGQDSIFDSLWKLSLFETEEAGEWSGTWKLLGGDSNDNFKPPPTHFCTMTRVTTLEGKNVLALVSGFRAVQVGIGGGYREEDAQTNDIWYYDTEDDTWTKALDDTGGDPTLEEFEIDEDPNDFIFARFKHGVHGYNSNIYMYGGAIQIKTWGYPQQLVLEFPPGLYVGSIGENPQSICDGSGVPSSKSDGKWCKYDESKFGSMADPRAFHSCVLRNSSQMVCFGGIARGGGNRLVTLSDVLTIDLDRVSLDRLIPATESYSTSTPLVTSMYFFFALLSITVVMICLSSIKSRSQGRRVNFNTGVPSNRGARQSVVNKIPLIEYSKPMKGGDKAKKEGGEEVEAEKAKEENKSELKEEKKIDLESQETMVGKDEEEGSNEEEEGNEDEEEECCPICLVEFEDKDSLRLLPCKHIFHPQCVDVWLVTNKACPMCKQDIDKSPSPSHFLVGSSSNNLFEASNVAETLESGNAANETQYDANADVTPEQQHRRYQAIVSRIRANWQSNRNNGSRRRNRRRNTSRSARSNRNAGSPRRSRAQEPSTALVPTQPEFSSRPRSQSELSL